MVVLLHKAESSRARHGYGLARLGGIPRAGLEGLWAPGSANRSLVPGAQWWTPQRNLLQWSEAFNASVWTKSGVTISPDVVAAPDGTMTADKLVEDTATVSRSAFVPYALPGRIVTASVYVKSAGDARWLRFQLTGASAYFNPDAGSWGTIPSGFTAHAPVSIGDGWWRVSLSTTSPTYFALGLVVDEGVDSYTGDGTSGIYVWGAQLEPGSTASAYQKTNDFQSVFDYSNKGNALVRGTTSGSDTNDPTIEVTRDGLVLWHLDNVDDKYTSVPALPSPNYTLVALDGWPNWHVFGLDSTGQAWLDGEPSNYASVSEPDIAKRYNTLRLYAVYSRVLGAAEHKRIAKGIPRKLSEVSLYTKAPGEIVFGHTGANTVNVRLDWTGGGTATVDWGDGSASESMTTGVDSSHTYTDGLHILTMTAPDDATVTRIEVDSDNLIGAPPDVTQNPELTTLRLQYNQLTVTPNVSQNPKLVTLYLGGNQLTTYAGGLDAMRKLTTYNISSNALPEAAINAILVDLDTARVAGNPVCTVGLSGGTNAAPTGAGITAKNNLVAAGWSVTTA